jgi:spore coat polysaccharide biosynthesis protein SpsF
MVQARIGGSRLPGKVLRPIGQHRMIDYVLLAARKIPADWYIVVTEPESYMVLRMIGELHGFSVFAGPRDDLMMRFIGGALVESGDEIETIVRVNADCPLTSPAVARLLLAAHRQEDADLTYTLDAPLGVGVDVIKTKALKVAYESGGCRDFHREHVIPFLIDNSLFKAINCSMPKECKGTWKVAVDTAEDMALVERIFADLWKGKPIECAEVVEWLRRNCPMTGAANRAGTC